MLEVAVPERNWQMITANFGKLHLKDWKPFDGCVPFFGSPTIMPGPQRRLC